MSKSRRKWSSADEVIEAWSAVTATSRPRERTQSTPGRPLAWLAPATAAVIVIGVVGALLLSTPPRSGVPTSSPTATVPESPATFCETGVDHQTCAEAVRVALDAVRSSGWTPTRVWIGSGYLCQIPDWLFNSGPVGACPQAVAPAGGQWVASVEVAFAETTDHAGLDIARTASGFAAVLIGYRTPDLGWCSGTCPSEVTVDGPYRLELVLPHLDWNVGDPISGSAILSYTGSSTTTISGSSDVVAFSYADAAGTHTVTPVWTADCVPLPLDPATPINQALSKSGAVYPGEPDFEFLNTFLTGGPEVRLPEGVWDITAMARFADGSGCAGTQHNITTTVRITVGNVTAPPTTPTTTPTPTTLVTGSPTLSPTATVTPTQTANPLGPWSIIGDIGADWFAWAPDGSKLLIHTGGANAPTTDQVISLVDRQGKLLNTYQGDRADWVDAKRVLLYSWPRRADGTVIAFEDGTPVAVNIETGASDWEPIPIEAVSSGRGQVAYPTNGGPGPDDQFDIWTGMEPAMAPRAGWPLAWSPDGSRLALWHYTEPACCATGARPSGWLEVIAWPDLKRLYADRSIRSDMQVEFDPTGRYLLFSAASGSFTIADTSSGRLTPLPIDCCSTPVWDDQSRVLVADDGMTVRTFDTAGAEVDSLPSAGESVTATPDGRVVAAWFSEANIGIDTGRLTVIRDGSPQVFPLPGADRYPVQFLAISPDGTRIAAICETDEGAAVLLLPLD